MINLQTQSQSKSTRGAALMVFLLLFIVAGASLTFILARSIFSDVSMLNSLAESKQSFLASESLAEEIALRYIFGTYNIDTNESLTIYGATAYGTSTVDTLSDETVIDAQGDRNGAVRKSRIILTLGAGTTFNYGLQAGNGGIDLANSAGIEGNVYSNGPVTGSGNSSYIDGDVVSAGPTGYIYDIHASGSAFAHVIEDSLIEGELNVAEATDDISNSVTSGVRNYYGVGNDQPTTTFPFNDAQVEDWKDDIDNFGTVIAATDPECSSGTYTIEDPDTIGFLKVECDLDIKDQGSPATILTLTGPIWVEGNISFTQGPTIEVDPALNRRSVQIIAHNESDTENSSQIEIRNSTQFNGSGDPRSYIMLLSMNDSAKNGGSEVAIDVSQSANGALIVYAGHGLVDMGNGIDLKEVTAHQINVAQNSTIEYESGLQSLLFTSGPGGSYVLADWEEVF